jgi:two-component system, cell cycle sensor histidine kinase and response regulator CckA
MDLDVHDLDYRALFDRNPLPIIVVDNASLRIVHVNDTAVENYGYTREEFLAISSTDLRPSEDVHAFVERFRDSSGHGGPGLIAPLRIWRHKRKDGTVFPVEIQRMTARLGGAEATVAFVHDVSARLHAEAGRRQLEEQLHHAQKMEAVGLLAGGIAHDFNNVLGIIIAAAQLAESALASGKPLGDSLASIVEASTRAAALIRQLLTFSRDRVLVVETIELRSALSAFAPLLASGLGAAIAFETRLADVPLWVAADRSQVEQVLLNLCTNAGQAMPGGGRLILELRKAVIDSTYAAGNAWAQPGEYAEIRVTDTGAGIDEETRARVFEPFFSTKADGTGLGLAVVHAIVQRHKGCVDIESRPGVGTTVRVLLPTGRPPQAEDSARTSDSQVGVGGKEMVLVADDEPSFRRLIARILTELGYRVVLAADGEEAVRAFDARADEIDLVILDGLMPRMTGAECYRRIKALKPSVKALLMTGYAADGAFEALATAGGPVILRKPFAIHDLARAIRTCLDA